MKGIKMINKNPFNKTSRDNNQILREVGRAQVALLQSGGNSCKISLNVSPINAPSLAKK
jgi:hypothetical protein